MDIFANATVFVAGLLCGIALVGPAVGRGVQRVLVEIRDDLRHRRV